MLRRQAQKVKGGISRRNVTASASATGDRRQATGDKKRGRDRVLINAINTTFLNSASVTKARKKPSPALQGELVPLYVKFVFIN
ncbi:TPA: hypothetical protein MIM69_15985 [Klebsiella variicola]|nr:hypothetical protein OA48_24690 [Klebsiella variicola]HBT4787537.1 hypothetical protein [Klebsiella variicola subsp. variicola]HBX9976573.1 hypothetical protein [Klebsiella variicola]